MINNSPPDGSARTPTPPAQRDGAFYANKSSCLKTFAFLIGLFTGKICFWVVLCQNGMPRRPAAQGSAQRQDLHGREAHLHPLTGTRPKGGAGGGAFHGRLPRLLFLPCLSVSFFGFTLCTWHSLGSLDQSSAPHFHFSGSPPAW